MRSPLFLKWQVKSIFGASLDGRLVAASTALVRMVKCALGFVAKGFMID